MATFLVTPTYVGEDIEVDAEDFGITQTGALFFQRPAESGTKKITMAAFAPNEWRKVLSKPQSGKKEASKRA